MGKNVHKKIWNFILASNIQRWVLQRGERGEGVCEVASALVVNLMCRFTSPKPPYIELPFYFPKVSFCFLELPFGFPKMLVYFSKMPYHFPELPLSFPEFPSIYLLCMSFFKNAFLSWLYLLILLRAGQSDKIYLALVFFSHWNSLLTNLCLLRSLKPLHGVWFFMYFIQILASMIVWKMQLWSI